MTARHCALIVEDNEDFSLGLQQILKSLDCECIPVTNVEDAVRALETKRICLVLLDLEIRSEPDAIKGHVEHGKSLLRKIRQMHSEHSGVRFWLPVLVVSGFARERDVLLELMKDGASDVIEKPETKTISAAIRNAFAESGRHTHGECENHRGVSRDDFSQRVVVGIPGDRVKRRTTVRLGSQLVMEPYFSNTFWPLEDPFKCVSKESLRCCLKRVASLLMYAMNISLTNPSQATAAASKLRSVSVDLSASLVKATIPVLWNVSRPVSWLRKSSRTLVGSIFLTLPSSADGFQPTE